MRSFSQYNLLKNRFDQYDFDLYQHHKKQLIEDTCLILTNLKIHQLIISSGKLIKYFMDDQSYPFRCNPYFAHFCPLDEPLHFIHLQASNPDLAKLYLFEFEDFFHPKSTARDNPFAKYWNLEIYREYNCQCSFISSKIDKKDNTAYIGSEPQTFTNLANDQKLLFELNKLRMRKSDFEVHCARLACSRSKVAHQAVKDAFFHQDTSNEKFSERDYFFVFSQAVNKLSAQFPYPPVIACNNNASFLHYHRRSKIPPTIPYTLLIDAGVSACGYASDVSRTYVLDDQYIKAQHLSIMTLTHSDGFSDQAYAVFKDMLKYLIELHHRLVSQAANGVHFPNLYQQSVDGVLKIITQSGLITHQDLDPQQSYALSRTFYPHSLGHMLGLQVHDVYAYDHKPNKPNDQTVTRGIDKIQNRNLFTIEPGIYFIPMLVKRYQQANKELIQSGVVSIDQKLLEQLYRYGGMRWEDNIYINEKGLSENLTVDI